MIKINFANECYAMDIWNNISSKQKTKILENEKFQSNVEKFIIALWNLL